MSEKLSLFDDSSDSEVELKVNKSYATSYNVWRSKEELQKYKDLRKEEDDSESSSESEEEVPEFDEEFFRALSLLKGKDPRIYEKDFKLFKDREIVKKPKAVKQKPMYMKDYERSLVLERGGKFSDEDDDESRTVEAPTYNEEMENLKKNFKEAVGDSDAEDDDLLQVRTKTKNEEEAEDADYVKWLKGEEKEISEDVKQDMSHLRNYWNDPKLDEGEKYLRDYILNKKYLEKDDSEYPSYEELIRLSDDEKAVEEQENFEHKYNFRFEEPDEEFIKRYPRTVGDSLRKADNKRKQKREEKAERRRKEKEQKEEELKRLKALKRKEIEEKFIKLKEISGQDKITLNESDIESDFDPDKHDRKMREMFDDEYYQVEEDVKPEFLDNEELDSENWNKWCRKDFVDGDEQMSDEQDDNDESSQDQPNTNSRDEFANQMIDASLPKKKLKKKSLFAKVISQPKPIYDPDGKSFEQYLDEYYKLDYEDIVGGVPVRYRYRQVIPNDFGLSTDEILAADDRELNRWCSVKKTCQYRNDDEELYDVQAFRKKAQNPLAKKKCLPSMYAPKEDDTYSDSENMKGKKKYCEEIKDSSNEVEEKGNLIPLSTNDMKQITNQDQNYSSEISEHKKKSKKKKRRGKQASLSTENEPENTGDIDLDINRNNLKLSSRMQSDEDEEQKDQKKESFVQSHEHRKKSKKKNHKQNQDISNMETESEYCHAGNKTTEINSEVNRNESFKLDKSSKSSKRKRKLEAFSIDDSDSKTEQNDGDKFSPQSKFELISNSNETCKGDSNFISQSIPQAPPKKKKKKDKHKENDIFNKEYDQTEKSNSHHISTNDKKHKKYVSEEKRFGLSDERLSAYGINPKKFKNRIIYSKK